jgi:hypothetical protein
MAYYYFPSCKATAQFKEAGKKARAYVKAQFGINPDAGRGINPERKRQDRSEKIETDYL